MPRIFHLLDSTGLELFYGLVLMGKELGRKGVVTPGFSVVSDKGDGRKKGVVCWRVGGVWLPASPAAWYEKVVDGRSFHFDWDEVKADANERKHGIGFELASTVFFDPNLFTVGDVAQRD